MSSGRNSSMELNCPICMDGFVEPKQLRCGHTFCSDCIRMLIDAGSRVTCPVCRVVTDVPAGGLSTSFLCEDLISQLNDMNVSNANSTDEQDSETNRRGMQIFILDLVGRNIALHVEKSETIGEVKAKIYGRRGIPVDRQRLIYGGKMLADDRTLEFYNIGARATLHLVVRLIGGCLNGL